MQKNHSALEHLELIHEMNRLFLSFLHARAKRRRDCLGLAAPVCELLRAASEEQLDRAAALPRALFRLDIDLEASAGANMESDPGERIALFSLQSALLLNARHLSRRNAHLAQAFLGIGTQTLIRLRSLVLLELANIAKTARLVAASFDDEPWLWRDLLCSESEPAQRRIRLLAMQPRSTDMTRAQGARAHPAP
ncbi:MAG: hypothetical protein PVG24_00740 [Gammaproteobacteria bacterium]|jgi:hypothetical protein